MSDSRRRTPSDEIVTAVVEAALSIIETEGIEGLTIRQVAARSGVSPQSVYNHFDGKHGVVEAVFLRGFQRLAQIYESLPREDPVLALRESARRYRGFAISQPGFYLVMFGSPIPGFNPSEETKIQAAMSFGVVVEIIEELMASRQLTPGDPISVAQQMWMVIHGAVSMELKGMAFVADHADFYEDMLDMTYFGLGDEITRERADQLRFEGVHSREYRTPIKEFRPVPGHEA